MATDLSIDRCRNGHPFDEANTYWRQGTRRACKECRRARSREHQRRKREAQRNKTWVSSRNHATDAA